MQEIRITLETVTPLFLGGAQGKNGPPELRPPAFRGAMRYWFRAALGGVIGDNNLDGLRDLETAVFGNTDMGSPITVRIPQKHFSPRRYPILPHKSGWQAGSRLAIPPGVQFELVLQAKRFVTPIVWINAAMALNLVLTFGGVGLRSRRGNGSLQVVATSNPNLIPVFPKTLAQWKKFIQLIARSAISQAKKLTAEKQAVLHNVRMLPSLKESPAKFPTVGQKAIIGISDTGFPNYSDALIALMQRMPNERYVGYVQGGRQASPLWVRVIKADGQYRLLFCVLPSRFPGADYEKLQEKVSEFARMNILIKGWNTND